MTTVSATPVTPERYWDSLSLYSLYRLLLCGVFLFLLYPFSTALWPDRVDSGLFLDVCLAYGALGLVFLLMNQWRRPAFDWQLMMQMSTDILCLTLLTHAGGGIQSGMGLLLLVALAAAGLVSSSEIGLFFAALSSIAMLLQQGYATLSNDSPASQFTQVSLVCMAYFAVAWLGHILGRRISRSEQAVLERDQALADMEEANRLFIQQLPDGVLMVDELGRLRQFNPGASRLMGCELSNAEPPLLADCAPALHALFERWRNGAPARSTELTLSSGIPLRVRFLPLRRNEFRGAVIVLEDVRRVHEQAQQLKLASLGRLTANIAHEIRNPLSSISYAAELLGDEKRDEGRERLQRIILNNTARLNRIVQDVMQLNRRQSHHPEALSLDAILPAFLDELCHAEHADHAIFHIEALPAPVVFDRVQLEQILWNLCGNALRYCSKQAGSIRLVHANEHGRVTLDICDDGPGIDPQTAPHLFEPFFTTRNDGSGLGLYLSRELCKLNRATLEYRPNEGGGACFRIVFGEPSETIDA